MVGSSTIRKDSPSALNAKETTRMARPGAYICSGAICYWRRCACESSSPSLQTWHKARCQRNFLPHYGIQNNSKRLTAMQMRFEPVLQRCRNRWPGALEASHPAGVGAVDATQFLFHGGQVDAEGAALADDRAAVHHDLAQQRRITHGGQKLHRIDRPDPVGDDAMQ